MHNVEVCSYTCLNLLCSQCSHRVLPQEAIFLLLISLHFITRTCRITDILSMLMVHLLLWVVYPVCYSLIADYPFLDLYLYSQPTNNTCIIHHHQELIPLRPRRQTAREGDRCLLHPCRPMHIHITIQVHRVRGSFPFLHLPIFGCSLC